MRLAATLLLGLIAAPLVRAQNPGDLVITEVLTNPGGTIADVSGEWFEVYNMTFSPIDISGWAIRDSAASGPRPVHVIASPTIIQPGRFFVFGNSANTTANGGVTVDYSYGPAMALANSLDRIQILKPDPAGTVIVGSVAPFDTYTLIDQAIYSNAAISAKNGISRVRNDSTANNDNMDGSGWSDAAVTAVYGPGGRGTPGVGGTTLPVELVAFDARVSGSSARLTWTTASETNNLGFVVERQAGEAWNDASGLIAGRGTTTERHDYAFSVDGLTAGRHTFRLRQIDTDGTVHLSAPVTVEIGTEGEAVRLTMLGARAFRIETPAPQTLGVSVFDVLGRMVLHERMDVSGTREVPIPAALAAGTYVVRVEGAHAAAVRTFVVR